MTQSQGKSKMKQRKKERKHRTPRKIKFTFILLWDGHTWSRLTIPRFAAWDNAKAEYTKAKKAVKEETPFSPLYRSFYLLLLWRQISFGRRLLRTPKPFKISTRNTNIKQGHGSHTHSTFELECLRFWQQIDINERHFTRNIFLRITSHLMIVLHGPIDSPTFKIILPRVCLRQLPLYAHLIKLRAKKSVVWT